MANTIQRCRRTRGGFTLIELLVTMVVMGILIAMLLDIFQGASDETHNNAARANLYATQNAAQISYREEGRFLSAADLTTKLSKSDPEIDIAAGTFTAGTQPDGSDNAVTPTTMATDGVVVFTSGDEQLTQCVASDTGLYFCLRTHNGRGLISDAGPPAMYTTVVRSWGESLVDAVSALPTATSYGCDADCGPTSTGQRGWQGVDDDSGFEGDTATLAPRFVNLGDASDGDFASHDACDGSESICGVIYDGDGNPANDQKLNNESVFGSVNFYWRFDSDLRRAFDQANGVRCTLDGVDIACNDDGDDADLQGYIQNVSVDPGTHVFKVIATNSVGTTEKSFIWTFNPSLVGVRITEAPTENTGESIAAPAGLSAGFEWVITKSSATATTCQLDSQPATDCFSDGYGGSIDYASIGYGTHTWCVTASNPIGDTVQCWTWTVIDVIPPTVNGLAITENSAAIHQSGPAEVCYYPGQASGQKFAVAVNAQDNPTGIGMQSVTFPLLTNAGSGAAPGPVTKTSPVSGTTWRSDTSPTTTTYTFGTNATTNGTFTVQGSDLQPNTTNLNFTVTMDNTVPAPPVMTASTMLGAWRNTASETYTFQSLPAGVGCGGDPYLEYRTWDNRAASWNAAQTLSGNTLTITREGRTEFQVRVRDNVYTGSWLTPFELEAISSGGSNLLAAYKFDGPTAADVVRDSYGAYNLAGAAGNPDSPDWAGQVAGTFAASFGSGQRLSATIPGIDNAYGAYNTVSFWHYMTPNTGIIAALGNVQLYRNGDAFGFHTCPGLVPDIYGMAGANALNNQWVHITAVFHNNSSSGAAGVGTGSRIYINGVSQAMASRTGSAPCASIPAISGQPAGPSNIAGDNLMIGNNQWNSAPTGGYSDNFAVFNKQLTAGEISTLYDYRRELALIDRSAPTTPSVSGANAPNWSRTTVNLTPSSSDPNAPYSSGIPNYQWQASGSWSSSGTTTSTVGHSGVELCGTGCVQGSVNWIFRACDNAGNCSPWTGANTTKVDTIAPTQGTALIWGAGNGNHTDTGFGIGTNNGYVGWYKYFYDSNSVNAGGNTGSGTQIAYYQLCGDWAYNVWDGGASYPCGGWTGWLSWGRETTYGTGGYSWSWGPGIADVMAHVCWDIYDHAGNVNHACADQGTGYWYGSIGSGVFTGFPDCSGMPWWEWMVVAGCLQGANYNGWGGFHGGGVLRWWGSGGAVFHIGGSGSPMTACWSNGNYGFGTNGTEWATTFRTRFFIRFPYAPGAALARLQAGALMHWTPDAAAGDNGYPGDHPNSDYYAYCSELYNYSRHVGSTTDYWGRYVFVRNDVALNGVLLSYGGSGWCGTNYNTCRKTWTSRINAYANGNTALDYDDIWAEWG